MGTRSKHKVTGSADEPEEKTLTLDVFGVAMLLPAERKVVMVDGRKGRVALDGKSVIPPHVPFVGIEPTAIDDDVRKGSALLFSYDVDGTFDRTSFECFLLDRHTVTFEGVAENRAIVDDSKIPHMSNVLGKTEICPGVRDGSLERVVATIDLEHAKHVSGKDHGSHTHAISFGGRVNNWAEKITAVFDVKEDETPVIRLKPKKGANGNGNGKTRSDIVIPLKGSGPWTIMIANVPPGEVMNVNDMAPGQDVPLTHLELLYDLYHIAPGQTPSVPTCAIHDLPQGLAAMSRPTAHRVAGSGAHCGPPVSGG